MWISNLALLFGAELDAEIERGRELQAGLKAEDTIQLPRDIRVSDKALKTRKKDIAAVKRLREHPTVNPDLADDTHSNDR